MLNAHHPLTTWTSHATALSDTPVASATKMLTSVVYQLHAGTVPHAAIQTDLTHVYALKAMKESIALPTQMTVRHVSIILRFFIVVCYKNIFLQLLFVNSPLPEWWNMP